MKTHFRLLPCALVLACSASLSMAQTSNRSSTMGERSSFIPYTQQGYVGLSAGQSKYSLNSGTGGFNFDDTGNAFKIYAGGYFNPNFGMEFGYLNFGKGHRLGGTTKAQGFNLSLVGRVPLNEQFDVFGKVGTTYARTRTSGFSGLGVQTGKDNGFGLSYGLGARWSFSPQWAAVVEWERHRLHFADGTSAGSGKAAPPMRLLGWAGLGLVVGSALALDSHTTYPGAWALLPTLGRTNRKRRQRNSTSARRWVSAMPCSNTSKSGASEAIRSRCKAI